MQFNAIRNIILHTHFKIIKFVDGDGLFVENIFDKEEIEVRFYGIDAPEIKKCRKLYQDERETQLPGSLLIQLGAKSLQFIRELVTIGTSCTLIQEKGNETDVYGRMLAYVILPNGDCLNEILIKEGFAKPYNKIYCQELGKYQEFNLLAKQNKKGLYSLVDKF